MRLLLLLPVLLLTSCGPEGYYKPLTPEQQKSRTEAYEFCIKGIKSDSDYTFQTSKCADQAVELIKAEFVPTTKRSIMP